MRNRLLLALLPIGLFGLAWACSSHDGTTTGGNDAGGDADADADNGGDDALDDFGNLGDTSTSTCHLADMMTDPGGAGDPIALCLQLQVLTQEFQYAYVKGQGVAPGWASTSPYAALPRTSASWQDDLSLAGAIGGFYCSALVYGDSSSDAVLASTLNDLGGVLVPELQQALVTGYDGETYFRLRWAQAAYNYANNTVATKLQALASAYGQSIYDQIHTVPAGGGDAGSPGGMVIGVPNADGSITYSPAQTVMAAAALLDMANLEAAGADAGANPPVWASAAQQVLTYVLARGRDPVSGLFYQSLTTSADPGHDTVGTGTPTNDSMLTETQAWVIFGLARAQDLLDTYNASPMGDGGADAMPSNVPTYDVAANTLAVAIANAGLFDGTTTPPPAPASQPVGALMEGLILSGQQLLTNKTTIGNGIYLGGMHRVAVSAGAPLSYQLGEIRSALGAPVPLVVQLANTSLMTVVTDQNGDLLQQAYLRAGSKNFHYAQAYVPGAEPVEQGQEPGATNYLTAANHAAIEGLTQLWYGAVSDARCAP
jgi:hypothetical protein